MIFRGVILALACMQVGAFQTLPGKSGIRSATRGWRSQATIAHGSAAFDGCVDKMTNALGLQETDYCSSLGMDSWNVGEWSGQVKWLTERSPDKLTGIGVMKAQCGSGTSRWQISAWVGPSYEVPHFSASLTFKPDGSVDVMSDFIARDDLAYCGGAYVDQFYGSDVMSTWTEFMAKGSPGPVIDEYEGRLITSCAMLSLNTDASTADAYLSTCVDRWLSWLAGATAIPARRRGIMNSRDDSLRRFAYQYQTKSLTSLAGSELGPKLGAAVLGPVSEAYVGGAS